MGFTFNENLRRATLKASEIHGRLIGPASLAMRKSTDGAAACAYSALCGLKLTSPVSPARKIKRNRARQPAWSWQLAYKVARSPDHDIEESPVNVWTGTWPEPHLAKASTKKLLVMTWSTQEAASKSHPLDSKPCRTVAGASGAVSTSATSATAPGERHVAGGLCSLE